MKVRGLGARYSPLIALAAVQILLVWAVPSNDGIPSAIAGGAAASNGTSSATGAASGVAADSVNGPGTTSQGSSGASSKAGATAANRSVGPTAVGGQQSGTTTASNSGCLNGHQAGPTYYMPPCTSTYTPVSGATMTGVTGSEIRFVYFIVQGNAQVNAILSAEDLAASPQEECQSAQAFTAELNKRFNFYGRKLVSLDGPGNNSGSAEGGSCNFPFFQSQCTVSPPDQACFSAESDEIAAMKPAFVIGGDGALFRVAQDHVMVVGGAAGVDMIGQSQFDQLYPYYYNVFSPVTQVVNQLGSYYCTKLVGKPARFAGQGAGNVIPLTGPAPTRVLGILHPDDNNLLGIQSAAQQLAQIVGACGGTGTKIYTYNPDISTSETQEGTLMAELKSDHITTLACLCDAISPVFWTSAMDQQNYQPEFMIGGNSMLDYDPLAQLYSASEMRHAFGLSELGNAIPFGDSDTTKAWQDAGNSGSPNPSEVLQWMYFSFMGNALQLAGPNLTVANLRAGLSNFAGYAGDAAHPGMNFKNPYPDTAIKDVREVWYCPTQQSAIDGKPGAWVPVQGGARMQTGFFQPGDSELFPGGACA